MNWRKYKYIAVGSLTLVPGLHRALRRGTGGTNSARYCYSVWLRHMVLNRPWADAPIKAVAELGPGDSLGIGLCALLCGAERYIALDALPHATADANLAVFDELVELFKAGAAIPDDREFPDVHPKLSTYEFPSRLLSHEVLDRSLATARLDALRDDLRRLQGRVTYRPRWQHEAHPPLQGVDLLISQAVLEHVDALEETYAAMFDWLAPGGVMSHQIDFKCHATAAEWNGHLAYSDFAWRLMRGNRSYFINRRTPSEHLAAAAAAGFERLNLRRVLRHDGLPANRLARRFQAMSEIDAKSSGGFLQAARPVGQV